MHPSWAAKLVQEFEQPYCKQLIDFIAKEYAEQTVYPPAQQLFAAFNSTPFEQVKVVILGQDPYHNQGQAHGLAFSVNEGVPFPPSLRNVFKEIETDLGIEPPAHGNLQRWADQGVLLLNATLTVRAHQPGSHQKRGWELFTDAVIRALATERQGVVFMLWGASAQKKGAFIDTQTHLVLKSVHPSPLSVYRGFYGCCHFSQANSYLGAKAIVW